MKPENNHRTSRLAVLLATSGHSGVDRIMGLLLPHIASRGISVDLLHIRGKGPHLPSDIENLRIIELGTSHSFTSLIPVIRYLKKERPDALLSDKDRVNQIALIAKFLSGVNIRVVVRFGQTVTKYLETRDMVDRYLHYFSMHYLYKLAHSIITPSIGSAQNLAHFAKIHSERINAIPNPIDRDLISRLASENVEHPWFNQSDIPVVIGLGELTDRKGFHILLRAFSILRKKKNMKLFIMGRGRGRNKLEKLIAELNLVDDVEIFGFVNNPFAYLGKASLFVQPSYYEGFGMALLEALSLGIPSVATDCPHGPREILQSGRYGSLVAVGDVEALANAMIQTLEAPLDPAFVMQAAIPYSLEKVADQYLHLLGFDT